MTNLPTPVVEREEKRAGELERGDWLALWHLAKVLFAERYVQRGVERVIVVYRDVTYNQPEVMRLDAKLRVSLATADEIPEDAMASGRDITETPADVPEGVDGYAQSESAIRKAHK